MANSPMRGPQSGLELELWVKADCAQCDRARELLTSLGAAMGFQWTARDVSESPETIYADLVPVVATPEGEVLAHAPLEAGPLVDAIIRLSAAR